MGPKKRKIYHKTHNILPKMMRLDTDGGHSSKQSEASQLGGTNKIPQLGKVTQTVVKALSAADEESDIHIPDTINVMKFAECRATEIATIMSDIQQKGTKLTLQQLPHHMRRRAASHNCNRVPRRLREKAAKEVIKAKTTKRPSRRHRRRPSNLLLDYIRRQRTHVWLETHIWFKKRFKMAKLWGYQIPLHPNDKNQRSAHKAVTQYAMLQDMSYSCCIQLEGPEKSLLASLSRVTNSSAGFTFASKSHIHGEREGRTVLYHPGSYPFQAIGPVSFLWHPIINNDVPSISDDPNSKTENMRKLWIWSHPSMYEEVIDVLMAIFSIKKPTGFVRSVESDHAEKNSAEEILTENAYRNTEVQNPFKRDTNLDSKSESTGHSETHGNAVQAVLPSALLETCEAMDISDSRTENNSNLQVELKIAKSPKAVSDTKALAVSAQELASNVQNVKQNLKTANPVKGKYSGRISKSKEIKDLMLQFTVRDPKLIPKLRTPESYSHEGVTITLLKDHLVRHRLIGPHSLPILKNVLNVPDVTCKVGISSAERKWWEDFYSDRRMKECYELQKTFWTDVSATGKASSGIVLALTVGDPRIDIPPKKTLSLPADKIKVSSTHFPNALPNGISHSPLWDFEIRHKVTTTKEKESELNKLRSKFLIPGSRLDLGREESRIPIILVHQPGNAIGYGEGWDIIIPCGWSMAFWIAFIYNGARAYGLRELKSIANSSGSPLFPFMYPDTCSGQGYAENNRLANMAQYLRHPPNKRPSFEKLGICHPFFMPWDRLVSEWKNEFSARIPSQDEATNQEDSTAEPLDASHKCNANAIEGDKVSRNEFFVLRSRKEVSKLKELCLMLKKYSLQKSAVQLKQLDAAEEIFKYFNHLMQKKSDIVQSLVCVRVECMNRGNASSYSGMYIPEESDLLSLKSGTHGGPSEAVHAVSKNLSKQKSKKTKKSKRSSSVDRVRSEVQDLSKREDLQRLTINHFISNCSRKLTGFLDSGGFSFASGHGVGIGHCSLVPLIETLRLCFRMKVQPIFLLRQQDSLQYRFAIVDVIDCFA